MNGSFFAGTYPWLAPMVKFFSITIVILLVFVFLKALQSRKWSQQQQRLKNWKFDDAYFKEILLKYPHLTHEQVLEAFEQLRLFFFICWRHEKKTVAMPSKLLDLCWHAFICDSRSYAQFNEAVFGRFLHHELQNSFELQKMEVSARNQLQMLANARTYHGALLVEAKERINTTVTPPKLFTIDELLNIPDGFYYSVDFLKCLADFDLEKTKVKLSKDDSSADGAVVAACGDGGDGGDGGDNGDSGCGGSV